MGGELEKLMRACAADPRVIDLAGGLPSPAQFPRRALARAFLAVLGQRAPEALQYGWPEGSPALRERIAASLRTRGAEVAPSDVLITNGAQEALGIAARLAASPGARVAVDPETYPGALDVFRANGLVPSAERDRADVFYAMPAVSNPRGTTLASADRDQLLASRKPIFEDDAYADLRFGGPPPPALLAAAPERVWHMGTFSKTLAPGLRVGWLVPPRRFLARARAVKHDTDLQANGLAQAILEQYLANENWESRLVRLRRFYAARAARLVRAVRASLPDWRYQVPEGGFALWLMAPRHFDELAFLRTAIACGVSFDPGSQFRAGGEARPGALRLCFSFVDARRLEPGAERLGQAWKRFVRKG